VRRFHEGEETQCLGLSSTSRVEEKSCKKEKFGGQKRF